MLNALDSVMTPLIILNLIGIGAVSAIALGTTSASGRAWREPKFKSAASISVMTTTTKKYVPPADKTDGKDAPSSP